jgi:hypothetical protein
MSEEYFQTSIGFGIFWVGDPIKLRRALQTTSYRCHRDGKDPLALNLQMSDWIALR